MSRPSMKNFLSAACLVTLIVAGSTVLACNVPVFRYALENWAADTYRLTIVHDENWSPEIESGWRQRFDEQARRSNLEIEVIDRAKLEEAQRELLLPDGDEAMPRLVLRYPSRLKHDLPVWSSELTLESLPMVTSSPCRGELVSRLAAGQTAVWLLVESGDWSVDDEVQQQLETLLKKSALLFSLPELSPTDPADQLRSRVPLKLEFSILRVPRSDAEEPFVRMLLEGGGAYDEPGPIVLPVFGRGRVLCAFYSDAINSDNVRDAAEFIVGACSCQVKEQNPGFDVLLSADWERRLAIPATADPFSTPRNENAQQPEYVALPSGVGDDRSKPDVALQPVESLQGRGTMLAVLAAVIVVAAALRLSLRRGI